MGLTTIAGLIIGVAGILVGFLLKGGSFIALFNPPGIMIVIVGTIGATILSFPRETIMGVPGSIKLALRGPESAPAHETAEELVGMADKARREGLLALEDDAQGVEDPFTRKGLMLMIDGTDPESLKSIMEIEIDGTTARANERSEVFKAAGMYSPTLGVVGAVLGLITVLSKLGGDAGELGHGIAVAFVATFYGVGLANVLFNPMGLKLKAIGSQERNRQEMVLEGILSIQAGDNPRIVREKLQAFLSPADRTTEEEAAAAAEERQAA